MQEDLFPETLEIVYNDSDCFDLSKPPIEIEGATQHFAKFIEKRVEFLSALPEGKFTIFRNGVDRDVPAVYNNSRGKYLGIDSARNVYPCLTINNKRFYMHTLVAMFFIHNDNPYVKCYVDHINHDPHDYRVENLEWVTNSENMRRSSAATTDAYMRRYKL